MGWEKFIMKDCPALNVTLSNTGFGDSGKKSSLFHHSKKLQALNAIWVSETFSLRTNLIILIILIYDVFKMYGYFSDIQNDFSIKQMHYSRVSQFLTCTVSQMTI